MSNQSNSDLVFDALGEPVRRRIVELLREGPRSVGDLARELPVGRPAVSKHLKVLSDAGPTDHTSVGTCNRYALRPDGLEVARQWLSYRWDTILQAYAEAAEQANANANRQNNPGASQLTEVSRSAERS